MSNPVGCRRKQPVFFDILILPVRVVESALVTEKSAVVEGTMALSAETKVSLREKRRDYPQ